MWWMKLGVGSVSWNAFSSVAIVVATAVRWLSHLSLWQCEGAMCLIAGALSFGPTHFSPVFFPYRPKTEYSRFCEENGHREAGKNHERSHAMICTPN
jgi:hypothetical protein